MKGHLQYNLEGSTKLIRTLAEDEGLTLKVDQKCSKPYKNGRVLTIPMPTPHGLASAEQDVHKLIGTAYEENQIFSSEGKEGQEEILLGLMQDYRGAYTRRGRLLGRDKILANGYEEALSSLGLTGDDTIDGLITTLNEGRNEWSEYNHREGSILSSELVRKGFIDKLNIAKDDKDVQELLKMIQEEQDGEGEGDGEGGEQENSEETQEDDGSSGDKEDGDDDRNAPDKDDGSQSDQGDNVDGEEMEGSSGEDEEGEEGEGEDRDQMPPDTEQERDDADNSGEDKADDSGESQEPDVDYDEIKDSLEKNGLMSPKDSGGGRKVRDAFARLGEQDNTPYIPSTRAAKVYDMRIEARTYRSGGDLNQRSSRRYLESMNLSKKIKKYLMTLSQTGFSYGHSKGKLHAKSITKIYTQKHPKIFKKRDSSRIEQDTAITLLLDCSGSMMGYMFDVAVASCIAISEVLTSIQIPVEILGFTDNFSDRNEYFIFKHFSDITVGRDEMYRRFSHRLVDLRGNEDGTAVLFAMERLLKRKERSKSLIVLSDGEPTGTGIGYTSQFLKDITKDIEDKGLVNLCGIGIQTDAVEEYYTNNYVLKGVEDLEEALLKVIRQQIIR